MAQRIGYLDVIFFGVMVVGFIAAVFHFASGRPMNGFLAASAALMGILIRAEMIRHPIEHEIRSRPAEPDAEPKQVGERPSGDAADRSNWLLGGVMAGFVATTVMTVAMAGGYLLSGVFALDNGNFIGEWFWGLTNNTLTNNAYDVPIGAYSINLIAGIFWAIVYTAIFEPRLRGSPWRRGLLFSLIPWILSIVVFFPLVGAGFLGLGLDAGPLPILGNLILHFVYGATLGVFYAIPERDSGRETAESALLNRLENRGVAIGLATGLVAGLIAGTAFDLLVSSSATATEALTAGAAIGIVAGALIGPFIGLDLGTREEQRPSTLP